MAAIVDAGKLFLISLALGLPLAACDRGASEQAASGNAAPPAVVASAASAASSGPPTARNAGSGSIGSRIDDSVITTKVKAALMTDDDIKGSDISVETRKGEVVLSGFVNSEKQIAQAARVAQRVEGVKTVMNKLTVKK